MTSYMYKILVISNKDTSADQRSCKVFHQGKYDTFFNDFTRVQYIELKVPIFVR